ncbi:MAG: sigma-70 family RNA polymerase sigma factor [Pseudomonadota bacterium]
MTTHVQVEDDLARLITRVALHDRRAFDQLYAKSSGRLFAVAIRIMKDKAEAEDVLQEAFIRIWQKAGSFRPGQAKAISWQITIVRNLAIDKLRARQMPVAPMEMAEDVPDQTPDPETQASNTQTRSQLDHCLKQLEKNRALAVRAAYLEGYTYQELADSFETPLNTIRTWLRRSLLRLRTCLEQTQT